jgi:D-glycero-D-manno-heptose 1,7-bisphosphate phosphatase
VSRRRGVFLDRDGTIIEDRGYVREQDQVTLMPGAARAIARLNRAGLAAVMVTNQSGIARGMLSEAEYLATQRRLDSLLAGEGARLEGHYFCPHLPEVSGPCECRKPGTLLYRRAAAELELDLAASWWIGDRLRDLIPARAFGGSGILVLTGAGREESPGATADGFERAADLGAAVEMVLSRES